jgi:hypothetical protein
MPDTYAVAALLAEKGIRVVSTTGSVHPEYLFAGIPDTGSLATWDTDFHIKMQGFPRIVACLIEQYLLAAGFQFPHFLK